MHMTISHTHGRWPVRVFTSLREMIHQPCHCSRCHGFCPITSLHLSRARLTNKVPVTLSNYEVRVVLWISWLWCIVVCQLSELDFHLRCLFVCTIGWWKPGSALELLLFALDIFSWFTLSAVFWILNLQQLKFHISALRDICRGQNISWVSGKTGQCKP